MIPIKDYNPARRPAVVTWAILLACIGIYFVVQPTGRATFTSVDPQDQAAEDASFVLQNAAIPCELVQGRPLTEGEVAATFAGNDGSACQDFPESPEQYPGKPVYFAVLVSMFLHGGFLHLAGNMLYLFIFGNNIEDGMGHAKYAVFYVASGLAATAAHVALDPGSTVPVVGASGAIAGVMGAYAVLHPAVRIRTVILFVLIFVRDIRAGFLLGFWFLSQFLIASGSGIAWGAHVGGFVFGAALGLVWRVVSPPSPSPSGRSGRRGYGVG